MGIGLSVDLGGFGRIWADRGGLGSVEFEKMEVRLGLIRFD
jgi:hypothetical protein